MCLASGITSEVMVRLWFGMQRGSRGHSVAAPSSIQGTFGLCRATFDWVSAVGDLSSQSTTSRGPDTRWKAVKIPFCSRGDPPGVHLRQFKVLWWFRRQFKAPTASVEPRSRGFRPWGLCPCCLRQNKVSIHTATGRAVFLEPLGTRVASATAPLRTFKASLMVLGAYRLRPFTLRMFRAGGCVFSPPIFTPAIERCFGDPSALVRLLLHPFSRVPEGM